MPVQEALIQVRSGSCSGYDLTLIQFVDSVFNFGPAALCLVANN